MCFFHRKLHVKHKMSTTQAAKDFLFAFKHANHTTDTATNAQGYKLHTYHSCFLYKLPEHAKQILAPIPRP